MTTATTISGLGFFDVDSDGLINSHQVGVWTSGGVLLASATVDNSSNVVASTSNLGDWLETDINSLTLNPGSYVLGAVYQNSELGPEDEAVAVATASSVPGISYGAGVEGDPGFTFPNRTLPIADNDAAFGPMAFTDSSSAPEPESLGLSVCALAFCGLAFRLRSRSQIRKINQTNS